MHFSTGLVLVAHITGISAAVQFTNNAFTGMVVGNPFNITWSAAGEAVDLLLKTRPASNQILVCTLATALTGNSYLWTPTSPGIYNFEIVPAGDTGDAINYSAQFPVAAASVAVRATTPSTGFVSIGATIMTAPLVPGDIVQTILATPNSTPLFINPVSSYGFQNATLGVTSGPASNIIAVTSRSGPVNATAAAASAVSTSINGAASSTAELTSLATATVNSPTIRPAAVGAGQRIHAGPRLAALAAFGIAFV